MMDGDAVTAALAELVRLKDVKDRIAVLIQPPNGFLDPECVALREDYDANRAKAWAAARAALAAERSTR